MTNRFLTIVVLALFAASTRGLAAAPQDDDPLNAATWYRRAWEREQALKLTSEDEFELSNFDWDTIRPPTPRVRHLIARLQPIVTYTRRAAGFERCDFGIDYTDPNDPDTLAPFGHCRSLMWRLRSSMGIGLHDGDYRSAIDRIVIAYRMAGHFAEQDVLVGSLVGAANIGSAESLIDGALDYAAIGPADAMMLLREIQRHDGPDPMRIREMLAKDAEPVRLRRLLVEKGRIGFMEEFATALEKDPATKALLESMTAADISTLLDTVESLNRELAAAAIEPDADKAKARIEVILKERLPEGPQSTLIRWMGGNVTTHAVSVSPRVRKTLDARKELFTGIAEGRIDPMSLANAAVWYVRAMQALEKVDPDKLRLIDEYAAANAEPPTADVQEALVCEEVARALDILRQAVAIERCDFSPSHHRWPESFRYYHRALLPVGRLLTADAARLLHDEKADAAAERIGLGYRIVAHLAPDHQVPSSLAAHEIFLGVDRVAERGISAGAFAPEQIALLLTAIRLLRAADPFHYQPSIAAQRNYIRNTVMYQIVPKGPRWPNPNEEDARRADAFDETTTPERALTLMVMVDVAVPNVTRLNHELMPELAGADAIFDMEAVQRAIELAPGALALLHARQPETLASQPLPIIAPVSERATQSQRDLWRALRRFGISAVELEPPTK